MKKIHTVIALSAITAAVLAACGGGGGGGTGTAAGPTQPQSVAVQTYITDNLATEYSKVWVAIKKITVVDGGGAEVTLLDATASPAVVNLSSLASVGQFMTAVTIPAGIYTEVRVTLDNSVQLVSLDGLTTKTATFAATGVDFVWRVRDTSVDASAGGQIVLDFNLAKFTYDAATGLVAPNVELPKPADAFKKFVRQQAEVHGSVQSVDAANGKFTIDDARLGKGVVVTLATDAVIANEADGKALALTGLALGARVEIKGTVTPGATTADPVTIVASVIHVEPANQAAGAARARGEGKVTAVSGSLITVAVDEANFLPGSNSVVVDIASAKFAHGQATDIAVGVKIEFGGTVSGTGSSAQITAAVIDVQGAQSEQDRKAHPEQKFSGVNGAIATLNTDGTFTVLVTRSDGPFVVPGTYTVDPTKATYREGSASCLAVGKLVKAVGSLAVTTLTAKFIAVPGCSGQTRSEPVPVPAAPGASAPAPSASAPAPGASAPQTEPPKPAPAASAPAPGASAPAPGASAPR
jgi:Domain of unknown function (DUF4382)/Domain of unknown function (DUF5666)